MTVPKWLPGLVAIAIVAVMFGVGPASAETPATLRIDAVGYVPAAYDPAIPEHPNNQQKNWSFGNPDVGGLLQVVVRNDGESAQTATSVTIDGVSVETLLAEACQDSGLACSASPPRPVRWARWLPSATVPAHGVAVFQWKRSDAVTETTVEIAFAETTLSTGPVELVGSPIRLGYAYLSEGDAVLIARNDGDVAADIASVRLDGEAADHSSAGGAETIAPHRTVILTIVRDAGFVDGDFAVLTVETSQGDATAALRLYEPSFPIGDWITSGWDDPTFLEDARDNHDIDTSWGYASTVQHARDFRFKLIADAVPCMPDQTGGCIAKEDEDLVAVYDFGDEVEFGHSVARVQAEMQRRRDYSSRPTFVNNASQRVFQEYGPLADIAAMDHYTSGIGLCTISLAQPATMQGQPVEWAGNYTKYLKLNNEPSPVWTWSQAGNNKNPANSCWLGLPTVDEMGAQLFSELANGTKGIMWFIFGGYHHVTPAPELWDEAANLGATLDAVRGWLSTGDLDPGALTLPPLVEAGAISGPEAVVVPIWNLDYQRMPNGNRWTDRTNVPVGIALPSWLDGSVAVSQVVNGTFEPVPFNESDHEVLVSIPTLHVGTVLVVTLAD